jgi:transcriptional regulator with XRE-family HTH domain
MNIQGAGFMAGFGTWLYTHRKGRKLTQLELATRDTVEEIARALGEKTSDALLAAGYTPSHPILEINKLTGENLLTVHEDRAEYKTTDPAVIARLESIEKLLRELAERLSP